MAHRLETADRYYNKALIKDDRGAAVDTVRKAYRMAAEEKVDTMGKGKGEKGKNQGTKEHLSDHVKV